MREKYTALDSGEGRVNPPRPGSSGTLDGIEPFFQTVQTMGARPHVHICTLTEKEV